MIIITIIIIFYFDYCFFDWLQMWRRLPHRLWSSHSGKSRGKQTKKNTSAHNCFFFYNFFLKEQRENKHISMSRFVDFLLLYAVAVLLLFWFFFSFIPPPSPPIWFTNDKRWLLFCRVVPCNAQCLLYSASESFQVIIFLSILHLPPPSPSFFCWMNYIYFLGLLQSIQYFFTASMDVDWKYRLEKILKKE